VAASASAINIGLANKAESAISKWLCGGQKKYICKTAKKLSRNGVIEEAD